MSSRPFDTANPQLDVRLPDGSRLSAVMDVTVRPAVDFTNLDIVPTVAALCDIDVRDLSFEGRSLVPQLFYDGAEDRGRIVFAETNAPQKERAAISERWKLIYYFGSNLYELYDLSADPWEHTNLAPQAPPAFATMKQALQGWMDRVMFVRDPTFNQAFRQLSDVVLPAAPTPQIATADQRIDGIAVIGIGTADGRPPLAGAGVDIHVYFHVEQPTSTAYRFQLAAWPVDPATPDAAPAPGSIGRTGPTYHAPRPARRAARSAACGGRPSLRMLRGWARNPTPRSRRSPAACRARRSTRCTTRSRSCRRCAPRAGACSRRRKPSPASTPIRAACART